MTNWKAITARVLDLARLGGAVFLVPSTGLEGNPYTLRSERGFVLARTSPVERLAGPRTFRGWLWSLRDSRALRRPRLALWVEWDGVEYEASLAAVTIPEALERLERRFRHGRDGSLVGAVEHPVRGQQPQELAAVG